MATKKTTKKVTKKTSKKVTKKTSKKKGTVLITSITKAEATALYQAFGFKSAVNWSAGKMQKKLQNLDKMIEGIELTPGMQKHVDTILRSQAAGKTIEVIDKANATADKKAQKEVDDASKREGDRKAEKKSKTSKKSKKTEPKEKKAKGPKEKKTTIDSATISLLKKKPISFEALCKELGEQFAKNKESLERTTKTRLHGYIEKKHGLKVKKTEKGLYFIN